MRVVLAEPSLLGRAGMLHLLEEAGFDVVGHAADGEELQRKLRGHRPDVAVIGIQLPEERLRAIRAELPQVGLLLVAERADARQAAARIKHDPAGAGVLLRERIGDVDRLAGAIRQVADGGSPLDPEVLSEILGRRDRTGPLDALTTREREVLAGMAEGESNRGLARRLFVSESAIERHVTGIFAKLGLAASHDGHRRVLAVLAYLKT